jgi:hypothetical protein
MQVVHAACCLWSTVLVTAVLRCFLDRLLLLLLLLLLLRVSPMRPRILPNP